MLEQPMFDGMCNDTPKRKKETSKGVTNNKGKKIKEQNIISDGRANEDKEITLPVTKKKRFVTIANDCCYLRDNKLGLYCRCGTRIIRKIKRVKKIKIVCLDCDESGRQSEQIAEGTYKKLSEKRRNG